MTIIDTPDGIEHFRMLQLIGALNIEVNAGMRYSRGSVMNATRERYGIQKQTKAGVLKELRKIYAATYGRECSIGAPRV